MAELLVQGSSARAATLRCKVVVVGEAACGKTALVQMHESGGAHFPQAYKLTAGVNLSEVSEAYSPDGETAFTVRS